jgi:hypothetical protein
MRVKNNFLFKDFIHIVLKMTDKTKKLTTHLY